MLVSTAYVSVPNPCIGSSLLICKYTSASYAEITGPSLDTGVAAHLAQTVSIIKLALYQFWGY